MPSQFEQGKSFLYPFIFFPACYSSYYLCRYSRLHE